MTVTVKLAADTAQRLKAKAAEKGTSLEEYLERLAEADLRDKDTVSELSDEEFARLLDELAAGPSLPPLGELSRADFYVDHD